MSPDEISVTTISRKGQNFSVMTPSVAAPSDVRSSIKSVNHHASNPNPQPDEKRHLAIREMALEYKHASPNQRKTMDMLKFGKRVIFDRRLNNSEMLAGHLAQVHD
jgi:hypothetical protein